MTEVKNDRTKCIAGCDDIKKGAKLIARLKNEGFLTRAKFPSAVRTPQRFQDRIRVYGDPFTSIGILVCGSLISRVWVPHSR
jgi:hypothetical protein